jgi:hypothetical protein
MFKILAIAALSTSALYTATVQSAFAANDVQYIDCHFANPNSTDRVVVSLNSPFKGTFFYTTGFDDVGESHDTGSIGIDREEDAKTDAESASYLAKWMTVQDGSKITVEFHFKMPKAQVFKASDFFNAVLTTNIIDYKGKQQVSFLGSNEDLTCFSRIYPKN